MTDLCEVFSEEPCELSEESAIDHVAFTEELGAAVAVVYVRNDGTLYVHGFPIAGAQIIGQEHLQLALAEEIPPGGDIFDVIDPSAWLSVGTDEENPLPILLIEGALDVSDGGIESTEEKL